MPVLQGKIALVTGGTTGIGLAAAVVFLASDQSSFMTGAELFVDGGEVQI